LSAVFPNFFRNFALLDSPRKPFFHLQSLDEVSVAFILIQPEIFTQDYDPRPESQDMAVLEVEDPEDLLVFAIVTAPPQGVLTANLQGPVYLNKKRCLGKQIVSAREIYRTRHNILEEMARKKAATC